MRKSQACGGRKPKGVAKDKNKVGPEASLRRMKAKYERLGEEIAARERAEAHVRARQVRARRERDIELRRVRVRPAARETRTLVLRTRGRACCQSLSPVAVPGIGHAQAAARVLR